ncbi:MAG: CZB domain-containing protein [Burkholderiales bacterium]|nr:CZB domain-containing protein [Burkholderiales bacterium]MDE1928107.1 CZB domain-containing protein [Burkholderiales bacterium]MDE2160035.1 CZB domain-containing protein [Burkholderiales bacterium]MDE2504813.1 CZB domain-containing protein [Burkholderiales bacterium]
MDLAQASSAHTEWKVKLRMAITKREQTDAATIGRDDCCALGKWLHGEAKSKYSKLKSYSTCLTQHAAFHREAGAVAAAINRQDYAKAEKMLDAGTPYATISASVITAILGLKKEAAL